MKFSVAAVFTFVAVVVAHPEGGTFSH
jgi:hypothetical protein